MGQNFELSKLDVSTDDSLLDLWSLDDSQCAVHVSQKEAAALFVMPAGSRGAAKASTIISPKTHHGRPILLPPQIATRVRGEEIVISREDLSDPLLHYMQLSILRHAAFPHNSALDDPWYQRHAHRARALVSDVTGLVLDVGCDNPALSRRIFPAAARYLGIDPGLGPRPEPCAVAMAEYLPLPDASVDAVAFLTSLDHVLDYKSAIDEAWRVVKPGGLLYLASLVWFDSAELMRDGIHFHHFRQYELAGALRKFNIEQLTAYSWKNDEHRVGIYLKARKPFSQDF